MAKKLGINLVIKRTHQAGLWTHFWFWFLMKEGKPGSRGVEREPSEHRPVGRLQRGLWSVRLSCSMLNVHIFLSYFHGCILSRNPTGIAISWGRFQSRREKDLQSFYCHFIFNIELWNFYFLQFLSSKSKRNKINLKLNFKVDWKAYGNSLDKVLSSIPWIWR